MMWLLLLLTAAALIYLLGGRPAPTVAREEEARRLIAHYREHSAADQDPQAQQERDYRLYQELSALLGKASASGSGRLSGTLYLVVPAVFCAAILAWQWLGGTEMQRWQRLYQGIGAQIAQHKIYGKSLLDDAAFRQAIDANVNSSGFFPAGSRHNSLLVYCQALQRRLDRSDVIELDALGDCYSELGLFELAAPVYDRIEHLQPESTAHVLAWAQAKTLANPEQPPAAEVMARLRSLIAAEPDNSLALLFLASAYQQHGQDAQALPLWEQLLQRLPADDPLYPAIRQAAGKARAAAQAEPAQTAAAETEPQEPQDNLADKRAAPLSYQAHIAIAPEILAQIPPSARLFVIIAPAGEKMPLAVKMLPPKAEQTVSIGDADSMAGASLQDYPHLQLRAMLSPSGSVGDPQALSVETPATAEAPLELRIAP